MFTNCSRVIPSLLISLTLSAVLTAPAARGTIFPGNGNTSFGGATGNGSLTVSDDGTGGLDLSFTFSGANTISSIGGAGNDLVVYLDNGQGGGLADTTGLADTSEGSGGREAISEYGGVGERSTLSFGTAMAPQYGIDFNAGSSNIFLITSGTALSNPHGASSYTIVGSTVTADFPATDFGLTAFSGDTINLMAIEVSKTGYSSGEATVTLSPATGGNGWGNTQTVTGLANEYILAVPEASTIWMVACGAGLLLVGRRAISRWVA